MKQNNPPAFPYNVRYVENNSAYELRNEGMTLLTYAAIHLKQPISERDDINAAIVAANRNDFAVAALQGIVVNTDVYGVDEECQAREAYKYADAMLAEREKANG